MIDVDRHGTAFGAQVAPDETIDDDARAIDAAAAWLAAARP